MKKLLSLLFTRQLLHWGGHVTICALPSFLLALAAGYRSAEAICAMLFGMATLIALYSLAGLFWIQSASSNFRKAVLWGCRLRSTISLLGLSGCFFRFSGFLIAPDFMAGVLSVGIVKQLRLMGLFTIFGGSPDLESFFPTFLTTLIQGGLISLTLFLLIGILYLIIRYCMSPITTAPQERVCQLKNGAPEIPKG